VKKGYWYIEWMVFLLLFLSHNVAKADVAFRSKEVERLVTMLRVTPDSLAEGINMLNVRGRRVKVLLNERVVTFVGYDLFSDELKSLARTPILNFLERYFLQLDYPDADRPAANMMREDRFRFDVGRLATVAMLTEDDAFSYGFENKRYVATWTREGEPLLAVSFPAEHELISGENKKEAELNVERDIKQSPIDGVPPVNEAVLQPTIQENYLVKRGSTYMKDLFTSDLYYERRDSVLQLICDEAHPLESAANLMLSAEGTADCVLNVKQVMYGYKKKTFDVPLRNWIAYCLKGGCELYFAAESLDEKEIRATVIAVNIAENYNHVIFVDIPLSVIRQRGGEIVARLESFIPMHNVQNLFAKYKTIKNKQPKIYE